MTEERTIKDIVDNGAHCYSDVTRLFNATVREIMRFHTIEPNYCILAIERIHKMTGRLLVHLDKDGRLSNLQDNDEQNFMV